MDEQYPIDYVLAIPFSFFIHWHIACIHILTIVNKTIIKRKSEFLFVIVFFLIYISISKAAAVDDGSGEA